LSGYSGYSGSGVSGYSGLGLSGYSGYSGYSGISGYSGYSGRSGYSGSGISGYSGSSGISGYSGYSGRSGYSGAVGPAGVGTGYSTTFTDANLSSGILTVTHNLANFYNQVQIFDNNNTQIIPDSVVLISTTQLTVDLSSFGTLPGTWSVVVSNGGGASGYSGYSGTLETSWTDYSASSTIVGWQVSGRVAAIYTKKIGKTVFVHFRITGTSDSTGMSFTLPYTQTSSAIGSAAPFATVAGVNAGAVL
jgi:hypothetical protein